MHKSKVNVAEAARLYNRGGWTYVGRRSTAESNPRDLSMITPRLWLATAVAALWVTSHSMAAEPAPRPNIIVILADDMGFSDLGCWEHEGNRAVREGRWKLVAKHGGPWELYDMETDRTELDDLAENHPVKVADLASKWTAWAGRVGVQPWPLRKPAGKAEK